MYIPVAWYDTDHRYSQFLRFLVSSRGMGGKKVTKSVFVERCWLPKASARNIWKRGAFVGEYFRGIDGETLYLRKQSANVLFRVSDDKILRKVKTLPDFRVFLTFLHAGKPNEYGNRSRTLRTIGGKTGTARKQTVSARVKKASKFGLVSTHRFVQLGEFSAQISNGYEVNEGKFVFNKRNPASSFQLSERKWARRLKKQAVTIETIEPKRLLPDSLSDLYSNYSELFFGGNKIATI